MSGMEISPQTSNKIANLSFVCALLVCAVHIHWSFATDAGRLVSALFRHVLGICAVQYFFLVAGFFLARHCGETGWWRSAVRKRIRTLLVPYLAWLSIYAILMLCLERRWVGGVCGYGINPFGEPMVVALWFLRTLMIFVLVSAWLEKALKRWDLGLLCGLWLLSLSLAVLTGSGVLLLESPMGTLFGHTFSLDGLFYFSLGMRLAWKPVPLSRGWTSVCWVATLLLVGLYLCCVRFGWRCPINLPTLVFPPLIVVLWQLTPSVRFPRALLRATFPIYLTHSIVFAALTSLGLFLGSAAADWCRFSAGVGIPILLSSVLNRSTRLSDILFGGRN